jgi:tRNA U34 5-methylaminomethyl-2-thiouridine-forming methyltransferase MnmC
MSIQVIKTKDGSNSLFLPDLNETYHSKFGAKTESEHVFIKSGYQFMNKSELRIFEVGFGTGLNMLLTLSANNNDTKKVYYESIEKYPLSKEILLKYMDFLSQDEKTLFVEIHQTDWEVINHINQFFTYKKIKGDLLSYHTDNQFDIIYFDAFAPNKQPQLWTNEIFKKMYDFLNDGGILVTYSAKGSVRRTMETVGFTVERLPGPPGKREMLRATKKNRILRH